MSDLTPVFSELRGLLSPYTKSLWVVCDDDQQFYLDTNHVQANKKRLFFGAVQKKKAHVSFHFMPIYARPGLLVSASEALKSRMQGKSCFNFKRVEPALWLELEVLVGAGYSSYQEQGFVP